MSGNLDTENGDNPTLEDELGVMVMGRILYGIALPTLVLGKEMVASTESGRLIVSDYAKSVSLLMMEYLDCRALVECLSLDMLSVEAIEAVDPELAASVKEYWNAPLQEGDAFEETEQMDFEVVDPWSLPRTLELVCGHDISKDRVAAFASDLHIINECIFHDFYLSITEDNSDEPCDDAGEVCEDDKQAIRAAYFWCRKAIDDLADVGPGKPYLVRLDSTPPTVSKGFSRVFIPSFSMN